jgi:hypothetical protein
MNRWSYEKQKISNSMKKLLTFLFLSVVACSAFAQRNHYDRRYNSYPVYQNNYDRYNERDRQIRRINAEYNFKINRVNSDWRLNRHQKKRAIKALEKQRAFEIKQVDRRFRDYGYNRSTRNRRYDRDRDNYGYNNGYKRDHRDRDDDDRDDD